MKIKDVKDVNLKVLWFDNMNNDDIKVVNDINDGDMKVINDMKGLGLKMLWFKKILIRLRRLRMPRTKKLIIKSESESDNEEKWSDSKFKTLLYCALDSAFDNIIIALNNRKLNDPKFDNAVAIWCFVIINLANAVIIIILLWLLYVVARLLSFMTRYC